MAESCLNRDAVRTFIDGCADAETVNHLTTLIERWGSQQPGHNALFVTFLTQRGTRAYVREMLPQDVRKASPQEWQNMRPCERSTHVPPHGDLIWLAEALTASCPECSWSHAVLECRTPAGQDFESYRVVVCMNEGALRLVELPDSRQRFDSPSMMDRGICAKEGGIFRKSGK